MCEDVDIGSLSVLSFYAVSIGCMLFCWTEMSATGWEEQ